MKDLFKSHTIIFILIPMILSMIGIIFIMSTGQSDNGQNNLYLRQLLWVVLGIGISAVILSIDYYYIIETSAIYYSIGIFLLIVTLLVGKEVKGAQSWLGIGGFGIQSSELMKLCYILFYAKFLKNIPKDEREFTTFYKSLFLLVPPLILVLLQPDMGTAIIFCSIYVIMSFIGFQKISILLSIIMIGVLTSILMLIYTYYQFYYLQTFDNIALLDIMLSPNTFIAIAVILLMYAIITFGIELIQPIPWIHLFTRISLILGLSFLSMGVASALLKPYQWNRLLVFINPEFDRLGSGYNIIQSQIAIGAGGLTGQGIFQGSQNLRGFLPEKHTDFIFAIIAEETGFLGSIFVILLYGIYCILIVRTILSSKDAEGSYIVAGILAMFATHIGINIGMNLGVAPVTGLPLPFISYGGSFYLTCITSSALILNIYSRRFIH
ncbi:MAG: FtsW/RodA/SpoVE family cell cycle protein [Brevinema sp.]